MSFITNANDATVVFNSCSWLIEFDENFPSKITLAGTPSEQATDSLAIRMRASRSVRAVGCSAPGTSTCFSGSANNRGGISGGKLADCGTFECECISCVVLTRFNSAARRVASAS